MQRLLLLWRALLAGCIGASVSLAPSVSVAQDASALKRELEEMRRQMQAQMTKIKALEKKVREIKWPANMGTATIPGAPRQPVHHGDSAPTRGAETTVAGTPVLADTERGLQIGHDDGPHVRVGANFDLLGAYRTFGPREEQRQVIAREVELALEAQVTPWLYGSIFLTRPDRETMTLEEGSATARLPWDVWLRAGFYRVEFGWLNTVHEPERPQVTLPLAIKEFFGEEQLREGAITVGKRFDLAPGHRLAVSGAIWNGDNEAAFSGRRNRTKPIAGKFEYGFEMAGFGLQTGLSAYTGKSDPFGLLASSAAAAHFNFFIDPTYNAGYDYPSRFSFFSELIFNRRQSNVILDEVTGETYRRSNNALGGWMVADYQFLPSHHLGVGLEYTQGALDRSEMAKAYSAHYSWYYTPHSRIQLQGRYIDRDPNEFGLKRRGFEALLQWNVVLGPHSERPLLPVLSFQEEVNQPRDTRPAAVTAE